MTAFSLIQSQDEFNAACARLATSKHLAIDTEFMRDQYYYAQLCLLQMAFNDEIILVDPFAVNSLAALAPALVNPTILKILHSGEQDLEILVRLFGKVPTPLFDTQIAASFLGDKNQLGYADLVQKELNVAVDKGLTRTDWSKRPLSAMQLEYAAKDVLYLEPLYKNLQQQLNALNRSSWVESEFENLTNESSYQLNWPELWRKVKRANTLKPAQLAVLQDLSIWREQKAQERNKPRRFITDDEVLIDLARLQPKSLDQLEQLRHLPRSLSSHDKQQLCDTVQHALLKPKSSWPQLPLYSSASKDLDAIAECLMSILQICAVRNSVSREILATRKEIEAIASGARDTPLLQGWRYQVAGLYIEGFLEKKIALSILDGKLDFIELR